VNLRLIVTILVIAAAPVCALRTGNSPDARPATGGFAFGATLQVDRAKERIKNALKQTFSVRLAAPCRLSSQPKNSMFRSHEAMSARV
jgi:hypothetical protein